MLTYLDRQKFEEIRAKWEAAQPKKQQQTGRMPSRKERPSEAYQPLDIDNDGRNPKFRRFSSIASFISPPNSFMTKAFSRRKQQARSSAANTSMTTLMNVSEAERLSDMTQLERKQIGRTHGEPSSGAASITQSCSPTSLPRSRISTPIHYPDQLAVKHIAAGKAFASASESPMKAFQRSHTPPNPLGDVNKQRPAFMIPRKAIYKGRTLPTPTKPSNKENMRVGKAKEYSPLEDRITRRDSKSMASKSIAQTEENQEIDSKARGKQPVRRTPVLSEINKSNKNERIQTPATAKCYQPASKSMTKIPQLLSSHEITQVELMGPRNPPTPPQPKTQGAPAMPDLDAFATKFTTAIRRKSQFSPQGHCSTLSQASARLVREVRSRSDPVPPVPPIPAQYCTPTSETKEDEGVEPPEVANMFQIGQSQTSQYWSGRFMSLSDRSHNDTFDAEMRPIDKASNYSNRSSEERRGREVFKELSRLCVTLEAISLSSVELPKLQGFSCV